MTTAALRDSGTRRPAGWDGKSLHEMLTDSEEVFARTGRYGGVTRLTLKEEDPIRYEKIWSRLRGGIVGARETALNISASPVVRELGELCFGLYTPEGDSITLSTGIMAHVHTMSVAIKHMVRSDYEENPGIADGDIFVNNDPFTGNVHNADVQSFVPLFYGGELVGWAGGVTHELDVGARQPTGMPIGHVSRFEDGYILPCMKVGTNDRLHRDYLARSQTAVRMPFYWMLDEKCRISGDHIIRQTVLQLIADEGIETYKRFIREVIEDTRRGFVEHVRTMLVPGVYRSPAFADVPQEVDKGKLPDFAARDSLMHSPMKITIHADSLLELDLDGASKWGYHCFNCTPAALQGGLWVGLTQTLIPNDKVNDGAYLGTRLHTPRGTWADPDYPLASTTLSWCFLVPAFTALFRGLSMGFMARGFLEEVLAGYPVTGNIAQGGGMNQYGEDGAWTNFEMSASGMSARYGLDGENSCAAIWNPEGDMGDVESWEQLAPMLFLGRNIRPNSGGPGKFRGGLGHESLMMVYRTPSQLLFHVGNGHMFPSGGLFGGYPNATLYRHSVKHTDLPDRIARRLPYPVRDVDAENSQIAAATKGEVLRDRNMLHLADEHSEHDIYLSLIAGGNGLGDVLERDPQKVADDLDQLYLLPRCAQSIYGVVAQPGEDGRWSVDAEATTDLRRRMRCERLERSVPAEEWLRGERERVAAMDVIYPVKDMYRQSMQLSTNFADAFRAFWNLPSDWMPPA
ncbi:MAG: hydantoinase B/oxoprolinase family protein [Deltaproteobacteria bacterium]|nr:hydantoinase B/oxoprolinase family protein [Deltaproteobacteria bacterium]